MLFVLFSYLPCELALIVLLVGLLYRNKSKTLRYFNFSMVFLVFTLGFYSFLVNATGDEKMLKLPIYFIGWPYLRLSLCFLFSSEFLSENRLPSHFLS